MKGLTQHILEKLKVSKNNFKITLESLINVFKDFKTRHRLKPHEINLEDVLNKYPTILDYSGDFTSEHVVGNNIYVLGCIFDERLDKDILYIYYNFYNGSIVIENTKELYEIFGEDVLNEIYDYLEQYEKDY